MKVFVDLHHFDLFYSFQLLFEKRLGYELYRPICMDWIKEGWAISTYDIIRKGYLSTFHGEARAELSKYKVFTNPEWARFAMEIKRVGRIVEQTAGIYSITDNSKGIQQKGITVDAFRDTKFDIIISSVPHHFQPFEELRKKYQPQAKHIFHAGNNWPLPAGVKNLMSSSVVSGAPQNSVLAREEFDLETFSFSNTSIHPPTVISYVHFPESERLMEEVQDIVCNDWSFYFKGRALGPATDIIVSSQVLANHIQGSKFTWGIKPGGEGYGHILHNSFACGTPFITSLKDYKGTCGAELLEDSITCIDVDKKTPKEIATAILKGIPKENVYNRFKEVVNFDKEFIKIQEFLGRLE